MSSIYQAAQHVAAQVNTSARDDVRKCV